MTKEPIKNDEVSIQVSSTSCYNCVFAKYSDNEQIGCNANRLEMFAKHGHEIIPIKNDNEDEKVFFVIDGKICVYYRNSEWAHVYYKKDSIEEILTCVQNELKIPYHVLLFFRNSDSFEDIKNRLSELENQDIKPKIITIVDRSHSESVMTGELMKICQNYKFDHWRIQTVQATDQIDNDVIDLVYDSTKKMKYMFYTILECSHSIPKDMSKDIHKSLHDDMKSFVVLTPNSDGIGKTVLKVAHEKYSGNSFTIPLEDKIVHYDDAPHLIKKVEEICPSLQVS